VIHNFALQAVRHGSRREYDAVVKIHDNPKTPTAKIAAMYVRSPHCVLRDVHVSPRSAMGSTADPALVQETFQFILDKAKDQDVIYFFRELNTNSKARRSLAQFFEDNYDVVSFVVERKFAKTHCVIVVQTV
jgi:aminopeptidase 2